MTKLYKYILHSLPVSVHYLDNETSFDQTFKTIFSMECFYQVVDPIQFKKNTGYDIENGIHRYKIEDQLKNYITNQLIKCEFSCDLNGLSSSKLKETELYLEDRMNHFYLCKQGFSCIDINSLSIKINNTDQKLISQANQTKSNIDTVEDLENEMEALFPELMKENDVQWVCECGSINKTKYCPNCGMKKEDNHKKIHLTL